MWINENNLEEKFECLKRYHCSKECAGCGYCIEVGVEKFCDREILVNDIKDYVMTFMKKEGYNA